MLHVLLLILKILGIIVLIIIGLVLLVLYSVLFVAASYRIHLEKQDFVRVNATARWLFRIVTVRYLLNNEDEDGFGWKQDLQVRLFGIPILKPFEEKPKKKRKQRKKKRRKKKTYKEQTFDEQKQEDGYNTGEALEQDMQPIPPVDKHQKTQKDPSEHQRRKRNPSIIDKLRYAIRGICDKIIHIWEKILGIGDAIQNLRKKKDAFLEFWQLEEHRHARGSIVKEIKYLWKKYHPKQVKGTITFGFADPADTGLCMGIVGMFCAWYPKKLQIVPDFEQKILRGDVWIKGKVRAYVLVRILWRVYFNQDVRHMYEHWKQL